MRSTTNVFLLVIWLLIFSWLMELTGAVPFIPFIILLIAIVITDVIFIIHTMDVEVRGNIYD